MHKQKNEPRQESSQATLARIKKEMDEPRMAESTREENRQPEHAAGVEKAAVIRRGKESRGVRVRGDAREGGK